VEKWPNFFIVGAVRSGTSSLYAYLKNIPGIYMSPVKEPNYFSSATIPDDHFSEPILDKKKYLSLFEKAKDEKIIGEASPSYLPDPEAPKLIHQVSPYARILISLRDPVERAFSHYHLNIRYHSEKLSFHDAIEKILSKKYDPQKSNRYLHSGLYSENVKTYLDTFGAEQAKILH